MTSRINDFSTSNGVSFLIATQIPISREQFNERRDVILTALRSTGLSQNVVKFLYKENSVIASVCNKRQLS